MTTQTRKTRPSSTLEKQLHRLIVKLAMRDTYLAQISIEQGSPSSPPQKINPTTGHCRLYGLFTPRNNFETPVLQLKETMLKALLSYDLVRPDGDHFRLSKAGASWLKRRQTGADSFRAQHQVQRRVTRDLGDGIKRSVTVNCDESPLAWLKQRKDKSGKPLMSEFQFTAGERLRADFWRAQMTPRITASWGTSTGGKRSRRGAPGSGVEISDAVISAKQRVQKALKVVGPEFAGVLIDVCCHLTRLEDTEKAANWPQRSGKVVLLLALTRLARHYGLVTTSEVARPVMRRIQHWGSHDYRPTIKSWEDSTQE